MRVAVVGVGEVGRRAALMLLGSPEVSLVGTVGFQMNVPDDRVVSVAGIDAIDDGLHAVMVDSDQEDLVDQTADAATARAAPVYSSSEFDIRRIAIALTRHELSLVDDASDVVAGYTTPGRTLPKGVALPFPEPVGPRWGRVIDRSDGMRLCEATVGGPWGAVTSLLTSSGGETRAVGVSDLAVRLDAFALAAALLTSNNTPSAYVQTLLGLGMEAAVTTVPDVERSRRRAR